MHSRLLRKILLGCLTVCGIGLIGLYAGYGQYGLSSLAQRGVTRWVDVAADDARFTSTMRLALMPNPPSVTAGPYKWKTVEPGFDVAELPVLANGQEVDRILLSRADPVHFDFIVRNQPAGLRGPEEWLKHLGATLVINGSYYGHRGLPDTPFVQDGQSMGPADYDAREGAFISSKNNTMVVDLAGREWRREFEGARDALVSYPLLVSSGAQHAIRASRWLANRSFVAQDKTGRVVFGTTENGFFSLDRLAAFLRDSPLDLKAALNLDGGPVASQAVDAGQFHRDFRGQWEVQVTLEGQVRLLTWPWGSWGLPVVVAAIRK